MSLFCINHRLAISDDDSMRHGNGLRPALLSAVSRRLRIGVAGGHSSQSYWYRSSQPRPVRWASGWSGRATTCIGSRNSISLCRAWLG
ncbi:hypothetical protein D3C80_1716520 [compost metagenome]